MKPRLLQTLEKVTGPSEEIYHANKSRHDSLRLLQLEYPSVCFMMGVARLFFTGPRLSRMQLPDDNHAPQEKSAFDAVLL